MVYLAKIEIERRISFVCLFFDRFWLAKNCAKRGNGLPFAPLVEIWRKKGGNLVEVFRGWLFYELWKIELEFGGILEEKSVIGPVIGRTSTKIPRNAPAVNSFLLNLFCQDVVTLLLPDSFIKLVTDQAAASSIKETPILETKRKGTVKHEAFVAVDF